MDSMQDRHPFEKDLVEVLDREKRVYCRMLELSHQKREALSLRDVERLKEITTLLYDCIAEEETLSQRRDSIMRRISEQEGIAPGEVTLAELSRRWQNSYLNELRQELKKIINELAETNEVNNRLIEQATDAFSFYRDLLYSFQEQQLGYNKWGLVEKQKGGYFEKEV